MRSFADINIMAVFSVKFRYGVIHSSWRDRLFSVIGQTLTEMDGVKPICIGGAKDHVHVLFSTRGNIPEEEIIRKIKTESTLWINANRLTRGRFAWQRGGARISYSHSALPSVIKYIENQEEHHRRISFREELEKFYKSIGYEPTKYDYLEDLQDDDAVTCGERVTQ